MGTNQAATFFLSGVLAAGYAVASLFFLRFWKASRDRLFLYFSAAFGLLVVQRAGLSWALQVGAPTEWCYVIRLLAFLVILAAIVDKNRA
jgi:hypothetical protein